MSGRIYYEPDKFQKLMDAMTKWQRVTILMKIELSRLGYEAEASRLMKLTKDQAGEELLRWQNAAGVAPDEPTAQPNKAGGADRPSPR